MPVSQAGDGINALLAHKSAEQSSYLLPVGTTLTSGRSSEMGFCNLLVSLLLSMCGHALSTSAW